MRSAQIDVGGRSISDGQWSVSDGRRVVVVAAALNASALTDRPTDDRAIRSSILRRLGRAGAVNANFAVAFVAAIYSRRRYAILGLL